MKTDEIKETVKKIKMLAVELHLKTNVITKDEYSKNVAAILRHTKAILEEEK